MSWSSQMAADDKVEKAKVARLLDPLPVPTRPWESVSMDFITHLLKTDDQTERFNCMLKEYLHHFVNVRHKNWVQVLDVAKFCFNAHTSSTIWRSPFEIVSGRQPVLPHLVNHPYVGKNPQTLNFTKEWKQINDITRGYLEKAPRQMKKWVDKKR
ncbi:reverse transcriptase [Cucumis melo var. makuwa]|uniref:Reverse transcriptase n=1 Tax=Cucumis melo var. makuwa TaxID=1194695 RepID=A0A5D3BZM2_CUCMM|nr:reverse transcriptase [Cucumis melo var. makuwa]